MRRVGPVLYTRKHTDASRGFLALINVGRVRSANRHVVGGPRLSRVCSHVLPDVGVGDGVPAEVLRLGAPGHKLNTRHMNGMRAWHGIMLMPG